MKELSDEQFKEIFPFDKPRYNQREIINKIINAYESGKKYVILSAPTGVGKSCIGYSVAKYFGSSFILTSQKVLQEQYYKDFKIPFVLGRSNYTCKKNSELTCENGSCFRHNSLMCKTKGKISCPYVIERDICISSPHSNLNYSYFLSLTKIKDYLMPKDLIICDEAHQLENELIKLYNIKIDNDLLKYIGCADKVKIPSYSNSDLFKCKWLTHDLYEEVRNEFLYLHSQIHSLKNMEVTKEYKKIANKYLILEKLITQINQIQKMLENNEIVVVLHENNILEYKMLHCKRIFSETIQKYSDKFLFMSATIFDKKSFIKDLNLDENLTEFIECDAVFPVKNRLIKFNPIGSMSFKFKDETLPLMIKKIENILNENDNVKGIIHTVNYDIAEKIIKGLSFSKHSKRLLMPRGNDKQTILNMFYNSNKPFVLISPALTEGIDLKDELSRFCIVCKVPYANLKDKWTKTRMDEDQKWYMIRACTSLVQMTGRSIRSESDFATTYILDSDFLKLASFAINTFPKWWQESVMIEK